MKTLVGICVRKPKDTIEVVETLIKNNCSVVLCGHAFNPRNPTIFMVGYGEVDVDNDYDVHNHFENMLSEIGGDVIEASEGHQAVLNDVVPPTGLQFAIDVTDNPFGITHRIGCVKYSPERAYKMAIEAAGLLINFRSESLGNVLARSMLQVALGVGVGNEDYELRKKKAA